MLSDPLAEALRLADLGLAVHWLWGPHHWAPQHAKPGKSVARKKWQHRPALTAEELRREYRRGRNLGLHTGLVAGAALPVVALDIDGDHGFIFCQQRKIPCSPVRTVTRTGQHWLYRHPGRGCSVPTITRAEGQLVDPRGELGNLVLPPSLHPSGFVYQPVEPWTPRLLRSMPTYDPVWLPPSPTVVLPRGVRCLVAPSRDWLVRARGALRKMWPAVQGQNGSRACFVAAATLLHRYQLSPDLALQLLREEYNPRCSPPWSEAELAHKVRSAARRLGLAV